MAEAFAVVAMKRCETDQSDAVRQDLDQPPNEGNSAMESISRVEDIEMSGRTLAGRPDSEMTRLAAVGLMTTGIVHDFGNLMQIVSSAIDLIERKLDQPKRTEIRPFTQGALASVGRATALSRQILGFSRADNAREEVVRLDAALVAIERPIRWMVGEAVQVDVELADDLPSVFCNAREFENAVLNLVINAKEAMPDGGTLRIAASREELGGEANLVLRVTDTGCGMSPETVKRAFQLHFTTKPASLGTGLGLAMVGDFVRRVGGSVQIESILEQGTSVVLRLPGCGN